jgi:hypothetical protein
MLERYEESPVLRVDCMRGKSIVNHVLLFPSNNYSSGANRAARELNVSQPGVTLKPSPISSR